MAPLAEQGRVRGPDSGRGSEAQSLQGRRMGARSYRRKWPLGSPVALTGEIPTSGNYVMQANDLGIIRRLAFCGGRVHALVRRSASSLAETTRSCAPTGVVVSLPLQGSL